MGKYKATIRITKITKKEYDAPSKEDARLMVQQELYDDNVDTKNQDIEIEIKEKDELEEKLDKMEIEEKIKERGKKLEEQAICSYCKDEDKEIKHCSLKSTGLWDAFCCENCCCSCNMRDKCDDPVW